MFTPRLRSASILGVALRCVAVPALSLAIGACRMSGHAFATSPEVAVGRMPDDARRPADGAAPDPAAPMLVHLQFRRAADTLHVTAHFVRRDPRVRTFFDPYTAGGWSFQLFLNTDALPSGYWRGYDYVVRGVELSRERTIPIRLTTGEPAGPDGWGPECAHVTLSTDGMTVSFPIPLAALGSPAGEVEFALETYVTHACPACPGGVSQDYAADYFGVADDGARHPLAFESPRERRLGVALGRGIGRYAR
jgi:hypothetical protein